MIENEQKGFHNDLQAPLKSFRLFAIEHFIHEGDGSEVVAALESAIAVESDEECQLLLGHAIASVRARGSASQAVDEVISTGTTAAEFPARFESSIPEERLRLLKGLKKAELPVLATWATTVFPQEKHPLVARELIRRFQQVWPPDQLSHLKHALSGELQTVRFAAIEALMVIAPRDLIDHLPRLLRAEDPRQRSLAIRALAGIDPAEARNHLEALLLSPIRTSRITALRECSRLPFTLTRPLLLSFMAVESDPALLDAAGAILAANPDPETPFRLADILAQRSDLTRILGGVLQTVIATLHASGQLQEDQSVYQKRLQEHVNRLGGQRIVKNFLLAFSLSDPAIQDEALETLRGNLDRPSVREALAEITTGPLPESVRAVVQRLLHPAETPLPTPESSLPENGAFPDQATEAEQVRWLAARSLADATLVEPVLQRIFSLSTVQTHVRTTAFRTALRLSMPCFKAAAEQALKQGEDVTAAAALEYLAAFSTDEILPMLGKYLKVPKARLRLAAIKILRATDPLQAISSLFTLLQAPDADERALSMNCLVQFDFPLIRDRLVELLESGRAPELVDSALALFEANPEVESLYPLFHLARHSGGEIAKRADLTRSRIVDLLVAAGRITHQAVQGMEAGFPARLQLDDARRAAPPPAYAHRALSATEPSIGQAVVEMLKQIFIDHGRMILGSLILGILLNRAFGCGGGPAEVKNPSGAIIQSGVSRAVGVLIDYEKFGWTVRQKDSTMWRLSPPPGGFPSLGTGMKVSVEAEIYRRGSDGVYLGRCLSIKVIQ